MKQGTQHCVWDMGSVSVSTFFPIQTVPGQAGQGTAAPCCGWVLQCSLQHAQSLGCTQAAPGAGPSSDSSPEIHISVLTPFNIPVCGLGPSSGWWEGGRIHCHYLQSGTPAPVTPRCVCTEACLLFNPCSSSELSLRSFSDLLVSPTQGAAVRA